MKPPRRPAPAPSVFAPLALVGYLGFGLIAIDQGLQVWTTLQGMGDDPATLRFQFATSLAARLAPLILGIVLLWAASMVRGVRVGLGSPVGLASAALAGLLLLAAVAMWFDGPAVRSTIGAEELGPFVAQWIRGLLLASLGVLFLGGLLVGLRKVP